VELRQDMRRVSTRPFVWLIAFLAVLALGLTSWYVVASGTSSHPGTVTSSGFLGPDALERNQQLQRAVTSNGFLGPDALERNQQLQQSQDPQSTHGH
jgi:hypothetical protein